jgi:hypothetical protein
MSESKHTPLPWRQGQVGVAIEIEGARGETVGVTLEAVDAALIVRAVNAHADLLAAAEAVLASLRAGLGEITGQGVRSPAFQSRADETAAALRDLKVAVAKARGA